MSTEVEDLQRILLAVHGDTLTRNEQLMEMHQQDVMTHNELSTSLQSSLESLLQNDVARISQSVIGFDSLLVCAFPVPRAQANNDTGVALCQNASHSRAGDCSVRGSNLNRQFRVSLTV